jgi:hypothetical protein
MLANILLLPSRPRCAGRRPQAATAQAQTAAAVGLQLGVSGKGVSGSGAAKPR